MQRARGRQFPASSGLKLPTSAVANMLLLVSFPICVSPGPGQPLPWAAGYPLRSVAPSLLVKPLVLVCEKVFWAGIFCSWNVIPAQNTGFRALVQVLRGVTRAPENSTNQNYLRSGSGLDQQRGHARMGVPEAQWECWRDAGETHRKR